MEKNHDLSSPIITMAIRTLQLMSQLPGGIDKRLLQWKDQDAPEETALDNLFDLIPHASPLVPFSPSDSKKFSKVYAYILKSYVQDDFSKKMALNAYNNPNAWLPSKPGAEPQVGVNPIYQPPYANTIANLNNGASLSIAYDSKSSPYGSISETLADQASKISEDHSRPYLSRFFWDKSNSYRTLQLNAKAADNRLKVDIDIDHFSSIPVTYGSWFNAGFLLSAYSKPGNWAAKEGPGSWESVFGPFGMFEYIPVGLLLAAGMSIKLHSFGKYTKSDLAFLSENSNDISYWPFFTSGTLVNLKLDQDESLHIHIRSPRGLPRALSSNLSLAEQLYA